MSEDNAPLSELEVTSIYAGSCLTFAMAALVIYDALLTCAEGINLLQRRRASVLSMLFVAYRLLPLSSYVAQLILVFHVDDTVCTSLSYVENIVALFLPILSSFFLSFRTYALSGRSVITGVLVFALSVFAGAPTFYDFQDVRAENFPSPANCTQTTVPRNPTLFSNLLYSSFATFIAAECFAIILTWYKTRQSLSTWTISAECRRSIANILMEDGMICFIIPLLISVVAFALQLQDSHSISMAGHYLAYTRDPITTVIISRFLLNLGRLGVARDMTADSDSIPLTTRISAGMGPSDVPLTLGSSQANSETQPQAREATPIPPSRRHTVPSEGLLLLVQMA